MIILILIGETSTVGVAFYRIMVLAYESPTSTVCSNSSFNYVANIAIVGLADLFLGVTLCVLFIRKLIHLMAVTNEMYRESLEPLEPLPNNISNNNKNKDTMGAKQTSGGSVLTMSPRNKKIIFKHAKLSSDQRIQRVATDTQMSGINVSSSRFNFKSSNNSNNVRSKIGASSDPATGASSPKDTDHENENENENENDNENDGDGHHYKTTLSELNINDSFNAFTGKFESNKNSSSHFSSLSFANSNSGSNNNNSINNNNNNNSGIKNINNNVSGDKSVNRSNNNNNTNSSGLNVMALQKHVATITNDNTLNKMASITMEEQRLINMLKVITRITVLVSFATMTTITLGLSLGYVLFSAFLAMDAIMNGFCILYCLRIYEREYQICCSSCHWLAFRCFLCCLFSAPEIENNNHNDNDNDQGSCNDENINENINPNDSNNYNDNDVNNEKKDEKNDKKYTNYKTTTISVNTKNKHGNENDDKEVRSDGHGHESKSIIKLASIRTREKRTSTKHAKALQLAFAFSEDLISKQTSISSNRSSSRIKNLLLRAGSGHEDGVNIDHDHDLNVDTLAAELQDQKSLELVPDSSHAIH